MNRVQVGLLIVAAIYVTLIVLMFGSIERRVKAHHEQDRQRAEACK